MKSRIFGKTNVEVSEIGLGTWQLGSSEWGEVSEELAVKILETTLDNHITFLDTADVYGSGRSEALIGKVLSRRPENIFVATKLGRLKGYPDQYSLELFRTCIEDSLRRLQVERLDLVQLHCVPLQSLKEGEVFDWLKILQKEGKIRYFGASVESMEEALICLQQEDLVSLQIIFNIFQQNPIAKLFQKAKAKGVALIIRLPLASGLLTGKFSSETTFDKRDHRNFNRDGQAFNVGETFSGLPFQKGVELVQELKSFLPSNMTLAQFAMRWILDFEEVSVLIPGATNPRQALDNVLPSNLPRISKEVHQQLAEFYENKVKTHIRGNY